MFGVVATDEWCDDAMATVLDGGAETMEALLRWVSGALNRSLRGGRRPARGDGAPARSPLVYREIKVDGEVIGVTLRREDEAAFWRSIGGVQREGQSAEPINTTARQSPAESR